MAKNHVLLYRSYTATGGSDALTSEQERRNNLTFSQCTTLTEIRFRVKVQVEIRNSVFFMLLNLSSNMLADRTLFRIFIYH